MKQSAMSPRTGRIIELDIAKGLGILSMILYNALPASPLHTALGGYMMPLFFVVSGLVMQRDACSFSLRRFWEKNARLLFYYILFSAIYLLCSVVTCIAGHGSYKALALDGIATLVGCGFNVLWFFSALFFGKLLCSLLTGSTLPRWAQGLFLAGLFLLAAGVGRAVDFAALTGVGRVLGKVPMLNKGLAYLGVHALYLMAIHNQPNLCGWLNKLSVKLCAGLPGWYIQSIFFLLLTVAALMIAMGLEPRLDPAVRALARRCTGQRKDQTNPERS